MREYFDKEKIKNYLKKYNKLQYFSDEILNNLKICECDPNEYIYFGGDELQKVKFLVEGTVLVTRFNEAGEETIVCLIKPFNSFGDLELPLSLDAVQNNVLSKSKCVFLSISRELILKDMNKNLLLYKMFSEELALKLFRNDELAYMATRSLEERYIELTEALSKEPEILNQLTQSEIARLLRASDRQLRRVIKKIGEEKV